MTITTTSPAPFGTTRSGTTSCATAPAEKNGHAKRTERKATRRLGATLAGMALGATMFAGFGLVDAAPAAAAPIDLDDQGQWGPVEDWPMVGIHAALDSKGRVVTYGTNPDGQQTGRFVYDIWTPNASAAAGHNTLQNTTQTDLFCSLQINRTDTGDMLLFGGDNWTGAGTNNRGNPDINQLDATTGQLTTLPGMQRSRWYATGTALPDGSIFIQGGLDGEDHPEHWTAEGGSRLLDIDTSDIGWYYPRNFVMSDGRIFGIDSEGQMYFISAQLDDLTVVGQLPYGFRSIYTTAVMFEQDKILYFGGPTAAAVVIDVTGGNPIVTQTDSSSAVRTWTDGTLLPDGRVLATGGSLKDSSAFDADPIGTYGTVFSAEIWDPATGMWTDAADAAVPRLYHSTALLLPDGRVLTAGGGAPGPVANTNAEIFSPDYLVAANGQATPRLTINGLSATDLQAGQRLAIAVSSETDVARVTLVKTGSVTHAFNMDQRFVELGFDAGPNGDAADGIITATLPVNDTEITPGYYLLSVLDENGIPSVSQMVHIVPPSPETPQSTIDGQLIRLYRAYVQRNPDQGGFLFWRRALLNGVGLVEISDLFAQSDEFNARYGTLTDDQFVDQIYNNVLGRPADAGGRTYWIQQLANGVTRGEVMVAFSESAEFIDVTGTADLDGAAPTAPVDVDQNPPAPPQPEPIVGYVPEVHRLYLGYFLRAPDTDGLTYWTAQRQAGITLADVSEQFALSQEFQDRYGNADDAQFVDLVYGNVLGRQPDADGRAYWIQQLADGLTRGELMTGFTESPEFVNLVGQIP